MVHSFIMKFICYSIVFILLVTSACKHEPEIIQFTGTKTDTIVFPVANDSVCFSTQILPLITASCAQVGCHDAITREEGLTLNSYTGIMRMGTTNLVTYITTTSNKRMPPAPQPPMDTASIDLIRRWIKEGAKNSMCNPTNCDTLNITYTIHIAPVVNTYCKGCHNASNKGGGVNLDNYADTKANTLTGKMVCTITANGCAVMPKGGPQLSKCNMRKIQIWASNNCPQ